MADYKCKEHEYTPDVGFEERQRAMQAMIKVLADENVCLSCGASAALYVAAIGATGGMKLTRESFLELAGTIYDDTATQKAAHAANDAAATIRSEPN